MENRKTLSENRHIRRSRIITLPIIPFLLPPPRKKTANNVATSQCSRNRKASFSSPNEVSVSRLVSMGYGVPRKSEFSRKENAALGLGGGRGQGGFFKRNLSFRARGGYKYTAARQRTACSCARIHRDTRFSRTTTTI